MIHTDLDFCVRRKDAERGSRRLRNAILKTLGYKPPRAPRKPAAPAFLLAPPGRRGRPKGKVCAAKVERIQHLVARRCRVRVENLRGNGRKERWVYARQVSMYVSRQLIGTSYPALGAAFKRDHTTVLHGVTKIAEMIEAGDQRTIKIVNAVYSAIHPQYSQNPQGLSFSGDEQSAKIAA
jgi:hypothetical protein